MRCATIAYSDLSKSGVPDARSKGGKNFRKSGKYEAAPVVNI
jgi:hypothetical protein